MHSQWCAIDTTHFDFAGTQSNSPFACLFCGAYVFVVITTTPESHSVDTSHVVSHMYTRPVAKVLASLAPTALLKRSANHAPWANILRILGKRNASNACWALSMTRMSIPPLNVRPGNDCAAFLCLPCQVLSYWGQLSRQAALNKSFFPCEACPIGSFLNFRGGTALADCQECPAGTNGWKQGMDECEACPAGSVSRVDGSST